MNHARHANVCGAQTVLTGIITGLHDEPMGSHPYGNMRRRCRLVCDITHIVCGSSAVTMWGARMLSRPLQDGGASRPSLSVWRQNIIVHRSRPIKGDITKQSLVPHSTRSFYFVAMQFILRDQCLLRSGPQSTKPCFQSSEISNTCHTKVKL